MKFLPPFESVKGLLTFNTINGGTAVGGTYDDLVAMLRRLIAGVQVDEAWYLQRYPDIAAAIRNGIVESAQKHFVQDGYFEGRSPFPVEVDEHWYLQNNPDVAEIVRQGKLASGQQHFDEHGQWEGRLPFDV